MNIPLEIAKNIAIKFSWVKNRAKKHHSTGMNQGGEAIEKVYDFYNNAVDSFHNKSVLEIGPGHTYQVAEKIKQNGASTTTIIDIEKYIDQKTIDQSGLNYLLYDGKRMPLENERIDVICSNTVYEHIRHPETTISETYRVLKKGGIIIHCIDLGDHLSYGVNNDLLFNCLKYPEWLWNAMTINRSSYVNRVRSSEWINMHRKAGFEIISTEQFENEHIKELFDKGQVSYLKKIKPCDRFISGINLVAKKPI